SFTSVIIAFNGQPLLSLFGSSEQVTIDHSPFTTHNFLILIFLYHSLPFSVPWNDICPFLNVPKPCHSLNLVFCIISRQLSSHKFVSETLCPFCISVRCPLFEMISYLFHCGAAFTHSVSHATRS